MEWKRFTIHTTEEAEEPVTALLAELGIEAVEVTDKRPFSAEESGGLYGDVVPEMPEDDHLAELSFYMEEDADCDSLLKELRSRFDILGGYSWQHFYNKKTERKLSNDGNNLEYAVKEPIFMTESYLVSFYGRLNWTLMDRYLLEANVRADGSSRFADGKRWGVFPSVSVGWRVSEEAFWKDAAIASWFDNLKIRVSEGVLGNQNIERCDTRKGACIARS